MLRKLIYVVAVWLMTVVLMALQKPLFLIWYASRAAEASAAELIAVTWHGLLLDSTTAGYITVIPLLVMLLSVWFPLRETIMRRVLNAYFVIISLVTALIVSVDMGLFRYWDFRIDNTVFLYLRTPKEAAASITPADMWPALLLFVVYAALMIFAYRPLSALYRAVAGSWRQRIATTAALLLAGGFVFLAIRGGTGTSPANVSKVYFSNNMFLNQAATNPVFSLLSSSARSDAQSSVCRYFGAEECAEVFASLRGDKVVTAEPIAQTQQPLQVINTRRPNVVLIIMESFGRTVTDAVVGGEAVTPNLRRIAAEGIFFENMTANSYRTDRGQVAIMSGFPSLPTASVMKHPRKAQGLPSIANALKEEGYRTSFTYGGDADFTNTMSYLYGTGVEQVTDQRDMHFDVKPSKWGYDDAVVTQLFGRQVLDMAAEQRPFFATLLTLSSHPPYDVPFSRFDDKLLNASAFTDECVGEMIDAWRRSEAWNNMLVIIIADHGTQYPDDLPTGARERQRIPMIWTGGAVAEAMKVDTYASQTDLAATLLRQMGLRTDDFLYSTDIFDPAKYHYGFWTYNNAFGMIVPEAHAVYDCTTERVIDSEGGPTAVEQLTRQGKAILQTLGDDINRR